MHSDITISVYLYTIMTKMTTNQSEATRCIGIKGDGNRCINHGKLVIEGKNYCKIHAPKDKVAEATEVPAPKRSGVSKAVSDMMVFDEIDASIGRRLSINYFGEAHSTTSETEELRKTIVQFASLSQENRRTIIKRASTLAGIKEVDKVIPFISSALSSFLEASANTKLSMVFRNRYLETIQNHDLIPLPSNARNFFVEEGSEIEFKDLNITVINCSLPYLRMRGLNTIRELVQSDPTFIYMGPKQAIALPNNHFEPVEDSEWYIPLPAQFKLRSVHNKLKVQEIVEAVEANPQLADRFLSLVGKKLGCVCLPSPCHCLVYVEVVRRLSF